MEYVPIGSVKGGAFRGKASFKVMPLGERHQERVKWAIKWI